MSDQETNPSSNIAIDLFAQFSTDTDKEEQGTYTTLPDCGDTKWLVARTGNPDYNKLLGSLVKKNKALLDSKGKAANAKSEEIMATVYAKTVLLGWQGNVNIKGVMTPYSETAALTMCKLKDFRAKVEAAAGDFNTFKTVTDEEDQKN